MQVTDNKLVTRLIIKNALRGESLSLTSSLMLLKFESNSTVHQNIPGVPKIKDNYNPATWMLEATSASVEAELKIDFAQIYKESHLCR